MPSCWLKITVLNCKMVLYIRKAKTCHKRQLAKGNNLSQNAKGATCCKMEKTQLAPDNSASFCWKFLGLLRKSCFISSSVLQNHIHDNQIAIFFQLPVMKNYTPKKQLAKFVVSFFPEVASWNLWWYAAYGKVSQCRYNLEDQKKFLRRLQSDNF